MRFYKISIFIYGVLLEITTGRHAWYYYLVDLIFKSDDERKNISFDKEMLPYCG